MAAGERPSGTSKTSTPSTVLPGLIGVKNDSLSGTFISAADESAVNWRPWVSSRVWLTPMGVCDSGRDSAMFDGSIISSVSGAGRSRSVGRASRLP
jgi:hypothetical protein